MEKTKFNIENLVALVIIMVTIIGSTVPLYIHSSSQLENFRQSSQAILQGIQDEMRDFHGRLCAIEERNRK